MKGYKAFESDMSCRGFKYEVGKTYETSEKIGLCEWGFHFCKDLYNCYTYYPYRSGTRIAEVEAVGAVIEGKDKCVTNAIKIIRELSQIEIDDLVNYGSQNRGISNTGNFNIGHRNTGSHNFGNLNTGYYNDGDFNTGNTNIGNHNAGCCNIGDYNTGDFNCTRFSSGLFCTEEPKILMFNKPSSMTWIDWRSSEAFQILKTIPTLYNAYNNQIRQSWYDTLYPEQKEIIKNLENFDAKIFYECTGIKVEEYEGEQVDCAGR